MQSSATIALIRSSKLHVLIACNHSELCILPLSVTVQFQRGLGQENECFDCANMIKNHPYQSYFMSNDVSSCESVE